MTVMNPKRLRRAVLDRLESLELAGVRDLPKAKRQMKPVRPETPSDSPPGAKRPAAATAPPEEGALKGQVQSGRSWSPPTEYPAAPAGSTVLRDSPREPSAAPSLDVLRQEVALCTRCEELACTRTQTVFGVGDPHARLCFLGEAPGADEDKKGEPFVGRAGQLLNKIIEACGLRREDVYICNILKCRPPGNRNPSEIEAANCRRFLERQLELVNPEFICCLGAVAAQNLLATQLSIGKLRGALHSFRGAKVVCTYHPAYLLRNPGAKKDTWEDMKFLMRHMGVEL